MTTTTENTSLEQVSSDDIINNMPVIATRSESFEMLMNPDKFAHAQRVARVYSESDMLPTQYRGNMPNCIIGMQMAMRMQIDPMMFFQNTYIVQGRPGMEAKLVIALANERGPFSGPIMYAFERDTKNKVVACTAFATHKKSGERCEAVITWDMVEKEGWSKRGGSKWMTIPEQMFCYRAAVFLIRRYCPEVILGMSTFDELEDIHGPAKFAASSARGGQQIADTSGHKMSLRNNDEAETADHESKADAQPDPKANTSDGTADEPAEPKLSEAVTALFSQLANLESCTVEEAEAAVTKYARNVKKKTLAELTDKQAEAIGQDIDAGHVKLG